MLPLSSLLQVTHPPSALPPSAPSAAAAASTMIPPNVQIAHDELIRDIRFLLKDCTEVSVNRPTKQFSLLTVNGCKTISLKTLKQIIELTCVSVGDITISLNTGSMTVSFHCFEDTSLCSCPTRLALASSRKRHRTRVTCEESSIQAIVNRIKNDFPAMHPSDRLMVAYVIRAIDMLQGDETPMCAATQVRESTTGGWAIDITGFNQFTFAQLQRVEKLFPLHVEDVDIHFGPKQATISLHSYIKPSFVAME